jgi:predicted Zn-dependent protease
LVALGLAAAIWLATSTRETVRMWHDDETLWRYVLVWYPDYGFANWKVAQAAATRNDFAGALPYAERAFPEYSNSRAVRALTGLVYLKAGRYEPAAEVLEPLLRSEEWMPASRYNLACAYARLGSNDAAVAVLGELVGREPQFLEFAQRDREFATLRATPQFAELVRRATP